MDTSNPDESKNKDTEEVDKQPPAATVVELKSKEAETKTEENQSDDIKTISDLKSNDPSGDPKESANPVATTESNQVRPSVIANPSDPNDTIAAGGEDVQIEFIVMYSKESFNVKIGETSTVRQLKTYLETITGVPHGLQKIMFKGLAKNEMTLKSLGITNGTKVMLVGSKLNDVLNLAATPAAVEQQAKEEEKASKEPLSKQKIHKKVLDKGVPEDAMPGILYTREPLPPVPLSGMLNKAGGKLRLTFKLELDELWLGTKERTEKIRMSSIKSVVSEPIEGQEQYHIMGLQLGSTEASRYWIYFVPAQYVESIKHVILDS